MAVKGKLKTKVSASSTEILHPETDAVVTLYDNTTSGLTATEVQSAIDEVEGRLDTLENTVENLDTGVSDVKDVNNNSIVVDAVATLSKAAVGLSNVTNDAQVKGLASGTTNGHLVKFGADGYTIADAGASVSTTAPSSTSTDAQVPTSKAVYTAISNIPKPMIFKGTLGTGNSASMASLPAPTASQEGWTLKVITAGAYNYTGGSVSAEVGDVVVCCYDAVNDKYKWMLIPSGDDIEDTWRPIYVNGTELKHEGISSGKVEFKDGGNVTVSGSGNDITLGVASGYSIPSTTDQSSWTAKYDKPSGGIPKTDLASAVQTSLGKADTALQGNETITLSGDVTGTGSTSITTTLKNSGVTAGTYSAVTVDLKGRVTAGGQVIKVINNGGSISDLAEGGIYFEKDPTT